MKENELRIKLRNAAREYENQVLQILKEFSDAAFGPGPESIREEVSQMGKSSTVSYAVAVA